METREFFRKRFAFLTQKLDQDDGIDWLSVKNWVQSTYNPRYESLLHSLPYPEGAEMNKLDEKAQDMLLEKVNRSEIQTLEGINLLLSFIWHHSKSFRLLEVPHYILPKTTLLYHISKVKFGTSDIPKPNRTSNYFLTDHKNLVIAARYVAFYQLHKGKEKLLKDSDLWVAVFQVSGELKLVDLSPSFDVEDAFSLLDEKLYTEKKEFLRIHAGYDSSKGYDGDTLNEEICDKFPIFDGVSMYGHMPTPTSFELMICGRSMYKVTFVDSIPYEAWSKTKLPPLPPV